MIRRRTSTILWITSVILCGFLGGGVPKALSATPTSLSFEHILTPNSRFSEQLHQVGALKRIVQDDDGYLWFGGVGGLVRYDAHALKVFRPGAQGKQFGKSRFTTDLLVDKQGVLWVGTANGLYHYQADVERFQQVQSLGSIFITALAVSPSNEIYVGTTVGLAVLERDYLKATFYNPTPDNVIHVEDILMDKDQQIWIGTRHAGLNLLDRKTGTFKQWRHQGDDPHSLAANHVLSLGLGPRGYLWVGYAEKGISRMTPDNSGFVHYTQPIEGHIDVAHQDVEALYLDSQQRFWVAFSHVGLGLYLEDEDRFTVYQHDPHDANSISSNLVRNMFEDRDGNLWVGNFPSGVNYLDVSASAFEVIKHKPEDPNSLSHNSVQSIFEDDQQRLWIGTVDGLNRYDKHTGKIKRYHHHPGDPQSLRFNAITSVNQYNNALWVSTWSGGGTPF